MIQYFSDEFSAVLAVIGVIVASIFFSGFFIALHRLLVGVHIVIKLRQ